MPVVTKRLFDFTLELIGLRVAVSEHSDGSLSIDDTSGEPITDLLGLLKPILSPLDRPLAHAIRNEFNGLNIAIHLHNRSLAAGLPTDARIGINAVEGAVEALQLACKVSATPKSP